MTIILNERFGGVGYENAWTEVVGGGNSLNEDANAALAGSPDNWLSECLQIIVSNATFNAYISKSITSLAISFIRFEFVVTAETLANNDVMVLAAGMGSATTAWFVGLFQTAGVVYIIADMRHNGSPNLVVYDPLVIGSKYRVEVKWDAATDTWEWWLNDVSKASGSLTSAHVTAIDTLTIGSTAVAHSKTMTFYIDNIAIDDSSFLGSRGLPATLSIRKSIVAAIIAQLKTISQVNGYHTDLNSNATEHLLTNTDILDLPMVEVRDGSEETEKRGTLSYNVLSIELVARIASTDIDDARNLLKDITEALKTRPAYPVNVYQFTLVETPELTPEQQDKKAIKFAMSYEVKYRE